MIHQCYAKKQLALLHTVFTAGSWPTVTTWIALSLGLLFPSLGTKITTATVIYISCYFGSSLHEEMELFDLYFAIVFFFFLLVEELGKICPYCIQWECASSLNGAIISQNVSVFEPHPANRYTSTNFYACGKRLQVTYRKCSLWTYYSKKLCILSLHVKEATKISQAIITLILRSESTKYFNCNLDLE